jgi:hypothetical protein
MFVMPHVCSMFLAKNFQQLPVLSTARRLAHVGFVHIMTRPEN